MIRESGPICRENIVELWDTMPRQCKQGPTGGRSFVSGASPRSSMAPINNTYDVPCTTQAVTSFVRSLYTGIPFCSVTIREGSMRGLHKDVQNSHVPSIAISLTDHEGGELWIEHPEGTVEREHEGRRVQGKAYSLFPHPAIFTSNLLLHGAMPWTGRRRLTLIAFTPRNVKTLSVELRSLLLTQGFALPTPAQLSRFRHNLVRPGTVQLSIPNLIARTRAVQQERPPQPELQERRPPQEISSSEDEPQASGLRNTGRLKPPSPGFITRLLADDQRDLENGVPWLGALSEQSQSSCMTGAAMHEGRDGPRRMARLEVEQPQTTPTPVPPLKRAKTMPATLPSRDR